MAASLRRTLVLSVNKSAIKKLHMFIEHIALWCTDIEVMKTFYTKYFSATSNEGYYNPVKQFSSYFLSFEKGARLEIMQMPNIPGNANDVIKQYKGFIHFAVSVGSKEKVDALTELLRSNGFTIIGEPRITGDGYYESVILDPENNRVEITV